MSSEREMWEEWFLWSVNLVNKMLGGRGGPVAEDAPMWAQHGLLTAIRSWDGERPFKTWAHKFVVGAALDGLRSWYGRGGTKRMVEWDAFSTEAKNRMEPAYCESESEVVGLMDVLSVRERVIVEGYYFEGYKDHELAERLGVSKQTVHLDRNKALEKMREKALRTDFGLG